MTPCIRVAAGALLTTSCAPGFAQLGDAALQSGDYNQAASYYKAELSARTAPAGLDPRPGDLSPDERAEVASKYAQALRHVFEPAKRDAEALLQEGFTVMALELVAPLCEGHYTGHV